MGGFVIPFLGILSWPTQRGDKRDDVAKYLFPKLEAAPRCPTNEAPDGSQFSIPQQRRNALFLSPR